MTPTVVRSALVAAAVLAGAVVELASLGGHETARATQDASASQKPPVFRSGVDLVSIDVSVVGRDGRPIEGLTADRFRVRVDGVERRIVSAVFVPHKPPAGRAADVTPTPFFSSNEHIEPGRLLLIVVDQQHIRRVEGLAALRAAASFIDQLESTDRVAAAPLNHIGPVQFTNEHASVKQYLQTLAGTATSLRGQYTLGLVEALAIADGQRTWLDRVVLRECGEPLARFENLQRIAEAEGVRDPCPVQVEQESRALAQEVRADSRTSLNQLLGLIARLAEIDGPKAMVLVSEGLVAEPQLIDLTALGAAAQAARVTIYVLQLEQPMFDASEAVVSPTLSQDLQVKGDGLARLAGSARGAHFRLVGADSYPFRKILHELSGYYLVAFESSAADRDGRTRRLDVSTTATNAVVRARPAFRAGEPSKASDEAHIVRLLRNPRLSTELPLRVTTHTFREPADGRMRVVVGAQADAVHGADSTIGYVLIDERGVITASGTGPAADGRLSQAVTVPAGRYRLKVAAVDATGRQGSVERTFNARLHGSGPIGISDLALTDTAPGQPVRPVIAHVGGRQLAAVLEIYGSPGLKLEQPSIAIDVKPADGTKPLISTKASVSAIGTSSWRARAELPLQDLASGSYVVTAVISLPDGAVRTVERGFVK